MNGALFRQTWRAQRVRLAVVSTALAVWGLFLPIIYARFGSQFRAVMDSGLFPEQFARFGGGDIFSLPGSLALSFIHPIAIILTSVFSVGFSAGAIAGERQRGTLEVALARPISRRAFYLTLLAAAFGFVAVTVASLLAGGIAGSLFAGVIGELALRNLPLLWLNGVLLFGSFVAIGLAASASFDRLPPALGVTHRRRGGDVLLRCPRLAVAGRRDAPAVLAVSLPEAEGDPGRGGLSRSTTPCWRRSSSRRRPGPSWCSRGATSRRRAERSRVVQRCRVSEVRSQRSRSQRFRLRGPTSAPISETPSQRLST